MAEWRKISFEPGYEISEFGQVRNTKKGNIIKHWTLKCGYNQLQVGKRHVYSVHRLVAMVFLSESKFDYNLVLHLDDDKQNNHYLNLKWGNQSENIKMAYAKGRHSKKGTRHHLAKFSNEQILSIRNRLSKGEGVCAIAREFKVVHQTISNIKQQITWKIP